MGQVHVQVVLTNYREAVMARLGQLDASRVHRYETEALIDTGAVRSTFLLPLLSVSGSFASTTDAKYADGRVEEVDMTEVVTVEILGRRNRNDSYGAWRANSSWSYGARRVDLMVDCHRNRLVPYQGTWDQPVFRV